MYGRTSEDGNQLLLNDCQKALLARSSQYGMTAEILSSWQPEQNAFINRLPLQPKQTQAVAQRSLAPPPKPVVTDMFEQEHAEAVMHLMNNHGMSAKEAIAEVSQLNPEEAKFLQQHYDGQLITGALLRDNDASVTCMDHDRFRETFSYLIAKQKYDKKRALEELKDLTPDQILMLRELYTEGVRGDHIRGLEGSTKVNLVFDNYGDNPAYRAYFKKVFKDEKKHSDSLFTALNHAVMICAFNVEDNEATDWLGRRINPKIDFLNRHHFQGLRAIDLPEHFTLEHKKTFTYLRLKHLSPRHAITEIKLLDAHRAKLLRDYYKYGVRSDHLKPLFKQNGAHLKERIETLAESGMGYVKATKLLADLSEWQGQLLQDNHRNGLTRQHLIDFAQAHQDFAGFSTKQSMALHYQLADEHHDILKTLEDMLPMNDADADLILLQYNMREPHPNIVL